MKFLDFSSLLDNDPAYIALFSTFQFDPDFFERRLLRCTTLTKARRIVVFIDARQWYNLLRRDVLARWLNHRYLVVPVLQSKGVFHAKLTLILTQKRGQVLCGSNNLTRSGCTSNLELLNAVPFDFENNREAELDLAKEAFAFFEAASKHTDNEIRRILIEWLSETATAYPWLKKPIGGENRNFHLLHTYDGSIWARLVAHVDPLKPKEFLVISPFHDADAEVCRRLVERWPRASLEFLVQQGYTNLPVKYLRKFHQIRLSELKDSSRRVHAKLLAWTTANGTGCLVGSANFTSAALDGGNTEACLLLQDAEGLVGRLFDRQLAKKPLAIEDFEPGSGEELESEPGQLPNLRIRSALLHDSGRISVGYSHRLEESPNSLRLAIRAAGEPRPRASVGLPNKTDASETVSLPDSALADAHGTLLATLIAEIGDRREESLPVWIIQEGRLTYEPGELSTSANRRIAETGEGLPEYIDELGKRDGLAAVIDYLKHLNIRFYDGGRAGPGRRKFRLNIRNPYHPDVAPEWLIEARTKSDDLEEAIYEFVDRHERGRLRRHASRGNINGMENFLDIFTTLIRLLYVYYGRGVVKKGKLIGRLCDFILLATTGNDSEENPWDGYLYSVYDNLGGDVDVLREVCEEANYLAEVLAALLIVQSVRFDPNEKPAYGPKATRPREVLQTWAKAVERALAHCKLAEPGPENVRKALDGYRMFTKDEITRLLAELPPTRQMA